MYQVYQTASPRYAHCAEMCRVQGWPMWTLGWSVCSVPAAKDSPALMRIPIIGPNLHTWPQAPPLYIANERVEDKDGESVAEKESWPDWRCTTHWSMWKESELPNSGEWNLKNASFLMQSHPEAEKSSKRCEHHFFLSFFCFFTFSLFPVSLGHFPLSVPIHTLLNVFIFTVSPCVWMSACVWCTTARGLAIS